MSRRRELPADPQWGGPFDGAHAVSDDYELRGRSVLDGPTMSSHRPDTAMQALMEAQPYEEPTTSIEELAHLREVLCDALDKLDEQAQWIVNAVLSGTSLRELGRQIALSKTHVARLRDAAFAELRSLLEDNPIVLEHLARNHTQEETE